jgi:hypothetical protein
VDGSGIYASGSVFKSRLTALKQFHGITVATRNLKRTIGGRLSMAVVKLKQAKLASERPRLKS